MQIEVKLFATFREGRFKTRPFEVTEGITLREVIKLAAINEDEVAIPLINGQFSSFDALLKNGDIVSLFPAVGGG